MYQKANVTELKADVQQISNDFSEKDVSTSNANDLWLELKDKLHTAVDKHVPSKTVGKRNNTIWINHTLKRLINVNKGRTILPGNQAKKKTGKNFVS